MYYGGPYRPSFRERLMRFFAGRNGFDRLCSALSVLYFVLAIINLFARSWAFILLEYAVLGVILFRTLSRNTYARQRENLKYYELENKVRGFFVSKTTRLRDREHVYRRCPSCKSTLRLPRRKGRHTVKCPRCSHQFKTRV